MAQVPTELTNFLNLPCDFTVCEDIQLGHCPDDVNSQGEPYQFTEYQTYYVTENVDIQYNSLTLRNCVLEFRNGASLIDNGINIILENDCDTDDNITQIVFIGGGNRFSSMAEYMQTLSIAQLEHQDIKPFKTDYFDLLGKRINSLDYESSGVYIEINHYINGISKTRKVLK